MTHLTAKNFEIEIRKSPLPAVVMFYAAWCGKCAMMKPTAEGLESKYQNKISFFQVDIDESADLAEKYQTDIVPAFVLFRNNQVVGVFSGVIEEQVFEQRLHKVFQSL